MNPDDPKVGDYAYVLPNFLFFASKIEKRKIIEVGQYNSMWLPLGETYWGAIIEIIDEDGEFETSPMHREQFARCECGEWNMQLDGVPKWMKDETG